MASSVTVINVFVFTRSSVKPVVPSVLNFVLKLVPFVINSFKWSLDGVHKPVSFSHAIVTWHFTRVANWLRWANWFWLFAVPIRNFSAFGFGFKAFLDLGLVDGFSGWYFDGFFNVFGVRNFHRDVFGSFTLDLSADGFLFETWNLTGDFDFFVERNLNLVLFGSVGFFHDRFWWARFADWLARFANWLAWLARLALVEIAVVLVKVGTR